MSLGGRLLNVFATPGDVFQEVKSAGAFDRQLAGAGADSHRGKLGGGAG